jgi:tetratricopeptide (TPR) repeat protein
MWSGTAALLVTAAGSAPDGGDTRRPNSESRGVSLFRQHDFEKATTAFLADLRANPNDVAALIYLGRIAFEENRLDAARRQFERATVVSPTNSEAFHWLGRVEGIQAREWGVPRGIGPARNTRKALERAVELDPNNLEARVDLATFYREAPFLVGGSRKAALGQVEEVERRNPYLGALLRGDMAISDKAFREAERSYRTAVDLQPKEAESYFRLGLLFQRTKEFDRAFTAFEKVLELNPLDQRAHFQIGKTADLSGQRLEQGEAALQAYLRCRPFYIMPKLSWAHRRLGNIYLKKGLREAARDQYLAALRLEPDDKEAAAALKDLR